MTDLTVLGLWLDVVILRVFSNWNVSRIFAQNRQNENKWIFSSLTFCGEVPSMRCFILQGNSDKPSSSDLKIYIITHQPFLEQSLDTEETFGETKDFGLSSPSYFCVLRRSPETEVTFEFGEWRSALQGWLLVYCLPSQRHWKTSLWLAALS